MSWRWRCESALDVHLLELHLGIRVITCCLRVSAEKSPAHQKKVREGELSFLHIRDHNLWGFLPD